MAWLLTLPRFFDLLINWLYSLLHLTLSPRRAHIGAFPAAFYDSYAPGGGWRILHAVIFTTI